MRFPGFRAKTVTLSYDDGVEQDARLIAIMREHGLKGTFNINTGCFAPEGHTWPEGQIHRRMTKRAAHDLYANSGMEVAVHTCTHPFLEQLPINVANREVSRDRENIEEMFGTICRGMAYPYGTYSDEVVKMLEVNDILYSRTVETRENFDIPTDWLRLSATCHHNCPRLMELAETFVTMQPKNAPQMFYLWGHSYEFESDDNWEVIEQFAECIGGRDDIWYATNLEIFEYIEAFERLRISNSGRMLHNPTATTLWMTLDGRNIELKPGETLHL